MNDDDTSDQSDDNQDVDGGRAIHQLNKNEPVLHKVNQVTPDVTDTNEAGE